MIPGGPINTYDEALRDPHTLARDMVVEIEHPKAEDEGLSASP